MREKNGVRRAFRVDWLEPRMLLAASLVADVVKGSDDAFPSVLTAAADRLFFRAFDGTTIANEPYVTDGTAAGTTLLKDIEVDGSSAQLSSLSGDPSPPAPAIAVGGGFFFSASTAATGLELWYTDGTTAGTRLVKDINPGRGGSEPDRFFLVRDTVYFNDRETGQLLLA